MEIAEVVARPENEGGVCQRLERGVRVDRLVGFGGRIARGLDSSSEGEEIKFRKKTGYELYRRKIQEDREMADFLEKEAVEERRRKAGVGVQVLSGRGMVQTMVEKEKCLELEEGEVLDEVTVVEEDTGKKVIEGRVTEVDVEKRVLEGKRREFTRWGPTMKEMAEEERSEVIRMGPVEDTFVSPMPEEERRTRIEAGIQQLFEPLDDDDDVMVEWMEQASGLMEKVVRDSTVEGREARECALD